MTYFFLLTDVDICDDGVDGRKPGEAEVCFGENKNEGQQGIDRKESIGRWPWYLCRDV